MPRTWRFRLLWSTLGRSDDLFLLLLQLFWQERKEKHNLQKPYSCTSLCSRQFLKRLNAHPDISYVMADQEIFAELKKKKYLAELKLVFCKLLLNFWNWLLLCSLKKFPVLLLAQVRKGKQMKCNPTMKFFFYNKYYFTVKYYSYYSYDFLCYYCQNNYLESPSCDIEEIGYNQRKLLPQQRTNHSFNRYLPMQVPRWL